MSEELGTEPQSVGAAARRWSRAIARAVTAVVVGAAPAAFVMFPNGAAGGHAACMLLLAASVAVLAWTAVDPCRFLGPITGAALVLTTAGAVAVALSPLLGRAASPVAFGSLAVAHLGLTLGVQLSRYASRLAVALVGASGLSWLWSAEAVAPTLALTGLAAAIIGTVLLFPDAARRLEASLADIVVRVAATHVGRHAAATLDDGRSWYSGWRARVRGPRTRRDVSVIAALVVATVLRVIWSVPNSAARPPVINIAAIGDYYSTMNFSIANQAARGELPSFGGHSTAMWPPGYGFLLSPLAWFDQRTGLISLQTSAIVLNVVLSVACVAVVAAIAARLISPFAAAPAAWFLAIGPSQIFATSVGNLDVAAEFVVLVGIWGAVAVAQGRVGPRRRREFLLGLWAGFAFLVSPFAAVMFIVPAVAVGVARERWRPMLRTTGRVVAGAAVLLVPWTVRNAVQVDWYSPSPTSVAEGLCTTKHASGINFSQAFSDDPLLRALIEDCFRNSPFDNVSAGTSAAAPRGWVWGEPREGATARRNLGGAVSWFVRHPDVVAYEAPHKLWSLAGSDISGMLDQATTYGREGVTTSQYEALKNLANTWYTVVAVLAMVGLAFMRPLRRLVVLWAMPLCIAASVLFAPYAYSRHFFPAQPMIVILAAGVVATLRSARGTTALDGARTGSPVTDPGCEPESEPPRAPQKVEVVA